MKDTLLKLRALVSMKTTIIKGLQEDIVTANRRMAFMEARLEIIERDNPWWKPLDEEMGRIEANEALSVKRQRAHFGSIDTHQDEIDYQATCDREARNTSVNIPLSIDKETS